MKMNATCVNKTHDRCSIARTIVSQREPACYAVISRAVRRNIIRRDVTVEDDDEEIGGHDR